MENGVCASIRERKPPKRAGRAYTSRRLKMSSFSFNGQRAQLRQHTTSTATPRVITSATRLPLTTSQCHICCIIGVSPCQRLLTQPDLVSFGLTEDCITKRHQCTIGNFPSVNIKFASQKGGQFLIASKQIKSEYISQKGPLPSCRRNSFPMRKTSSTS